jgi:hypothetical protein
MGPEQQGGSMKARWLHRSTVCTALAAAATLATFAPPALAGTHKVEAESGTIDNTGCGDDGPMAAQTGGTGQVVFYPGSGCTETFSGEGRKVDAINFFITGQASNMCGYFTASGSLSGTSSTLCIDGSNANETYHTVAFSTSGSASGTFTIEWHVSTGPSWVNAYVDFLTYETITVQAESGSIDNTGCGDDGPMAVQTDTPGQVVFYPGTTCSQTFNKLSNGALPAGIRFKVTGSIGTICGHFVFTGAYVGSSASVCGGTYSTAAVTATAGVGSTFTTTWVTDVGTPTYDNAYVDYLTFD